MRALLVDDDEEALRILTRFLEREGIVLVSVQDAMQGLDKIANERFDMVVTAYSMPFMSGEALLKNMKGTPGYEDVPVVVMTEPGGAGEGADDRLLREGAAFVLTKPLNFDQLLALMRFASF